MIRSVETAMRRTRLFVAVLCILVVLAGALLAPAAGGAAPAVLVPLAPLFGFVVLPPVRVDDAPPAYAYFVPGPRPSRAPPVFA
jgi:hypothetical protein